MRKYIPLPASPPESHSANSWCNFDSRRDTLFLIGNMLNGALNPKAKRVSFFPKTISYLDKSLPEYCKFAVRTREFLRGKLFTDIHKRRQGALFRRLVDPFQNACNRACIFFHGQLLSFSAPIGAFPKIPQYKNSCQGFQAGMSHFLMRRTSSTDKKATENVPVARCL